MTVKEFNTGCGVVQSSNSSSGDEGNLASVGRVWVVTIVTLIQETCFRLGLLLKIYIVQTRWIYEIFRFHITTPTRNVCGVSRMPTTLSH